MRKQAVNANQNSEIIGSQMAATKVLLRCGVAAGPLFLVIFAMQVLVRPEFRFTRSEPSQLSIGPLGWIQIANSVIGGLLIVTGALGMRRALRSNRGRFWGPLLLGVFGIGQVGGGAFVVDPIRSPTSVTFHGTMHIVCGAVGFVALMAACFVFARTFFSRKQRGWAILCTVTGILFLTGFLGAASANQNSTTSIQLFLNLLFLLEWIWVSSISAQILRNIRTSPTT
ncbi:MAG TPA: DUF998 domain-containing protein [Terriglobia bacterium]|nr:DUF998 domain-containing protein [Terriglobia bacterium]